MKKVILAIFCVFIVIGALFLIKIPEYVELNNLMIVEGIGVECDGKTYKLYLKEIIPTKDDTGISYKYKIYNSDGFNSLKKAYQKTEEKSKKKIFYKDARFIITNCTKSNHIIDYFEIDPNYIKHTKNDIEKEMKKK